MKLPHADRLEITKAKVVQYLLSSTHRIGKGKAAFFSAIGFTIAHWKDLAHALEQHAQDNTVTFTDATAFGTRYVIEGSLVAPNGRELQVRTVWFIDKGDHAPRFVTAYPLQRRTP